MKMNPDKNSYRVIGLMSGTSLDGVDLAFCVFTKQEDKWSYQIEVAETSTYSNEWLSLLPTLMQADAFTFSKANTDLGVYFGQLIRTFIDKHHLETDFIASHGHTVFHQPGIGLTVQIGNGAAIAATCGLPVVCDFRSGDVALGGQGAPLVPVGDVLLFSDFDFCLNLGGFSNVSYQVEGRRIAFDICPVNTILNALSERVGLKFDRSGLIARTGTIDPQLLSDLNDQDFYSLIPPKSLGFEWSNEHIWPLINASSLPVQDILRTVVEHIATQIATSLSGFEKGRLLLTGGGAKNIFLIERIATLTKHKLVIPSELIIDYKEALIFAFLGVLRVREEVNCLSSVTGASRDSVCGAIYLP